MSTLPESISPSDPSGQSAPSAPSAPSGQTAASAPTASPATTGPTPRDQVVNGWILLIAAAAWLGWAHAAPPRGWTAVLSVLDAVCALGFVAGMVVFLRNRAGATSRLASADGMRRYRRTVIVEVTAIVAGAVVLGITGRSDYLSPWILFVVGVHFVPLASAMRIRCLTVVGVLAAAVAVAAVVVGLTTHVAAGFVSGGLGGVIIGAGGAYSLLRGVADGRRLGWRVPIADDTATRGRSETLVR